MSHSERRSLKRELRKHLKRRPRDINWKWVCAAKSVLGEKLPPEAWVYAELMGNVEEAVILHRFVEQTGGLSD